jgi:glycosyltransferase involved in cell wall biosynthesis
MIQSLNLGKRWGKAKIPKLCIISLYSYPLFNPDCHSPFGGSEVRLSLLAKELARRGRFQVHLVVLDHGQPKQKYQEGLTIYPHSGYANYPLAAPQPVPPHAVTPPAPLPLLLASPAPSSPVAYYLPGLLQRRREAVSHGAQTIQRHWKEMPYLLYLTKRRPDPLPQPLGHIGSYVIDREKVAVYDEIDADIYMLPGCSNISAELAFYCQQRHKTYIFLSGSDGDYQPTFKEQPPDTVLYYGAIAHLLVYAIEHATVHVVQNEHQAQLLQTHYSRDSLVVKNPIDLTRSFAKEAEPDTVLWVGKADRVKRPEIMLELARHCPEYHFTMIMTRSHADIFERCMAEASVLPNVTILDYVPFQEVERYFARAKLFVNTSVFEGFPNTFLQAAKYAVPLVSLQVDPGEMLSRHGCGLLCAGDFDCLQEQVRRLMTISTLYADTSAKCIEYVRTHHDKDKIVPQFETLLMSLIASSKRG